MPSKIGWWTAVFFTSWMLLGGVPGNAADGVAENFSTSWIEIATQHARHRFSVELALSPEQREQGLQGRGRLAPDHGMLFDFGDEQQVFFWMKNTPIPLDMLFVSAADRIVGIARRTTPYSLKTIPSPGPVRYVIEVAGGTARRLGIEAGDRVSGPALADKGR